MIFHSKYKIFCIKAIQDKLSEDELHKFKIWLEKSPKNKAYYNKTKKLWDNIDRISVIPPDIDIKSEWALLENKLDITEDKKRKLFLFYIFTSLKDSAIAIRKIFIQRPVYAGLIIIISIIAIYLFLNHTFKEIEYQTFTASNKQKLKVQLSDGSSIQLNSGSSITVQDEFADDKREVRLNGEAYFDVAKEKRPCIILTDNAKIEVLGTSFNIWARNNQTRVIVKDGVVRLSSLMSENDFVIIQADQMSRVVEDRDPIDVKDIQAERFIGWPEGKLVFEHCPLEEFIGEIKRQYNINIKVQTESMKDLKLTGTFDNFTIDQVLTSVCLTFNFKCDRIDEDIYLLRQK
jgi:transmembrane sensor